MTTPMYTGRTPYLEGVTGCNEGVTCLRAQRPLPRFVHPSAETLLRPDSMRITLRSVLICRQRVEFSREFEDLVRSKFGYGASGRSNSLENSGLSCALSEFLLGSS